MLITPTLLGGKCHGQRITTHSSRKEVEMAGTLPHEKVRYRRERIEVLGLMYHVYVSNDTKSDPATVLALALRYVEGSL